MLQRVPGHFQHGTLRLARRSLQLLVKDLRYPNTEQHVVHGVLPGPPHFALDSHDQFPTLYYYESRAEWIVRDLVQRAEARLTMPNQDESAIYAQTCAAIAGDLRAAGERMGKAARLLYMSGSHRAFFDGSPPYCAIKILDSALTHCWQDANVVTLGELSVRLREVADRLDASVDAEWSGLALPKPEAEQDV